MTAKKTANKPALRKQASKKSAAGIGTHIAPLKTTRLREAVIERNTTETQIRAHFTVEGMGRYNVSTGIRFFDHMLELFTRHGGFDLDLQARGAYVERAVLSRAVQWHAEDRIIRHGNQTIVF